LLTREYADRLRTYLLKGGFLWVDDFWGSYAWDVFESEIRKVFPAPDYQIIDVPAAHPIFHTMLDLDRMSRACRRFPGSEPGLAAGGPRSVARTAPWYTHGPSPMHTGV